MNNNEAYNSVNKGIPNYVTIELSVNTLINECTYNKAQFISELKLIRELYRSKIIEINDYTKSQEYFFDSFRVITNPKNAKTQIFISPNPFLIKLKTILNVKNSSLDFNDLTLKKELLEKVEELKNIKSISELEQKFPIIYEDYKLSQETYPKIRAFAKNNPKPRTEEIQAKINRQFYLYNAFALDTSFKYFISKQVKMYRNLIVRRQFVERYTNDYPIDFRMFEGLDKTKFELYLADKYLTKAIKSTDDREKQECIYYLATYIRENMTKKENLSDIKIKNDDGKEISFSNILKRYKKFLQKNPLIKPIDEQRENFEGYHIKHVENHVRKYFFTNVNWQIVPPGTEDEIDKKVIKSLNRKYNYLSPAEREKKILERFKIYERKKKYFDNTKYLYKIFGINTFDGYIAYIYENGEVLMEKFFDDHANCLPTIGEAIYNIRVNDFEELSKYSKLTLIKDKRCKRIIHAGKWEEKSDEILSNPITEESKEQVKQLMLKINTKKTE